MRALLDLAGFRAWTQEVEQEGKIRVGKWTLATL
jgi:hypothetical protein